MAKRPYLNLFPADWQANNNLKRCTFEEKGIWLHVMFLFHDSDEYGILRWPLKDIAAAVNCDISLLLSLVQKGVLKGSDDPKEKVSFSTSISQKNRDALTVALIDAQHAPLWYSSRMVRDEFIGKRRAGGGFKALEHPNVPKKKVLEKDTSSPSSSPSYSRSSIPLPIPSNKKKEILRISKKERSVTLPDSFAPQENHHQLANQLGISVRPEFEHFKDHHLAKGSRFVSWDRAFSNWLRNAKKFNGGKLNGSAARAKEHFDWAMGGVREIANGVDKNPLSPVSNDLPEEMDGSFRSGYSGSRG